MASDVDICNIALSLIGSDAIVASIDPPDGSVEAGHCKRFYPIARAELLEAHTWTFSKRRVLLAEVANPSSVWTYAYALPSDCFSPVRVLQSLALVSIAALPFRDRYATADDIAIYTERGSADFEVENGVLLCHEPDATLLYTVNVTDPAKLSPLFVTALGHLLAAYLAGPLIKGNEGARTNATFRLAVFGRDGKGGLLGMAAASDANSSSERADHVPNHIQARA